MADLQKKKKLGVAELACYGIGNCIGSGIFVSMGQPSKRTIINKEGQPEERKFMELGVVTDERIADGHYYGQCFREWLKYMKDPELLEAKAETIVEDPDTKTKNKKWIMKQRYYNEQKRNSFNIT